jgi:hypothetical protein
MWAGTSFRLSQPILVDKRFGLETLQWVKEGVDVIRLWHLVPYLLVLQSILDVVKLYVVVISELLHTLNVAVGILLAHAGKFVEGDVFLGAVAERSSISLKRTSISQSSDFQYPKTVQTLGEFQFSMSQDNSDIEKFGNHRREFHTSECSITLYSFKATSRGS